MKQYKIFESPAEGIQAVKQGWSWPGFFFGWIWALVKRMWGLGLGVLGAFFLLALFVAGSESPSTSILYNLAGLALAVLFGLSGNDWREKNLKSRGFDYRDTLSAANPQGAVALYLKGDPARVHDAG